MNKTTGKLVWEDNSVDDRILHGQWSTPSVGRIGGVDQVVSAQGDGWVRGYETLTGKKLWEFDLNPKDSVWPKTRNEVISTPVIFENVVYISNGQDPEHGEGVGHAYAIDATKRGDITTTGRVWHFDKIRRAISTAAVSGASEPCTALASMLSAKSARMVPFSAFFGSVAPIRSRCFKIAFSPSSAWIITGPEIMNATRSLKKGRSLWTA